MSRKRDVCKVNDMYGVIVTLCSNSETVAGTPSGHDCGAWQEEATAAACEAAGRVLYEHGLDYECDSFFPHWHGGKHDRADVRRSMISANIYSRDIDTTHYGTEFGEWEWCGRDCPPDVLEKITAAIDAASDAAETELVECEAKWAADEEE